MIPPLVSMNNAPDLADDLRDITDTTDLMDRCDKRADLQRHMRTRLYGVLGFGMGEAYLGVYTAMNMNNMNQVEMITAMAGHLVCLVATTRCINGAINLHERASMLLRKITEFCEGTNIDVNPILIRYGLRKNE